MYGPFQPCLPSLGKWKLYCAFVHDTVSTASASDWFTASLAQGRLARRLDSYSVANLPPIHNSTICRWLIFINEFEWNATSGQRNKVDSEAWWYVPAVGDWQSRDLLFTTRPHHHHHPTPVRQLLQLCLGLLSQTERSLQVSLCSHYNAT